MYLQIGSSGNEVTQLQQMLSKILNVEIIADGIFGSKTDFYVKQYQQKYGLSVDGIVGKNTWYSITENYNKININQSEDWWTPDEKFAHFAVFVDAGHGTIDDAGRYTTSIYTGKKYHHSGSQMHDGNGWFYEGFENHIIAEMFIRELAKYGIIGIRTYDSTKDTDLHERSRIVKEYLKRGYFGYLHSIHSNAAPTQGKTKQQLDQAIGYCCYTTTEHNFSDEIASIHIDHIKSQFPNWHFRDNFSDGDADQEANFAILRETNLAHWPLFGAILDEFGFYTSEPDSNFIIQKNTREKRVQAMARTALWVKAQQENKIRQYQNNI